MQTSLSHQLLIDCVTIEQHIAQFKGARAQLNVQLLKVGLGLQVSPDALLQYKLEHPFQGPIHSGQSLSLLVNCDMLPAADFEIEDRAMTCKPNKWN
jgi:hypothetical protein